LYYLFYACISKIKDKNKIYTILNKTIIDFNSDDERWDFVNKLTELYKSFQEKNKSEQTRKDVPDERK